MRKHSFLSEVVHNPRKIFLLDSLGALLSAFFLLCILLPFEGQFGMPQQILLILSAIAVVFAIYSVSCFLFVRANWRPFLKSLYVANLTYCCLTAMLVALNYNQLTWLGLSYFLIEIVLIGMLVAIERQAVVKNDFYDYRMTGKSVK